MIVLTVLQLPPQREGRPPEEEEERAGGNQAPDELAVPHPLLAGVQDPAVLAAEGDLLDAPGHTDEKGKMTFMNSFYKPVMRKYEELSFLRSFSKVLKRKKKNLLYGV